MPEGILEYFELSKVVEVTPGLHIYLEEKNLPSTEYKGQKLESKGFLPEICVRTFPFVIRKSLYQTPSMGGQGHK
ncbi:ISAon1 family transposase N-terminal region protein [Dyadobacter diqingensis]|uniref:ISAon1 family transposase N-terminal region protein n=1 Tax=Dyadobacter diqingensis TaxID=2938121 RepID=UPI00404143A5